MREDLGGDQVSIYIYIFYPSLSSFLPFVYSFIFIHSFIIYYNNNRQLDAAYFFSKDGGKTFPLRGTGITMPTLDEVMDEFAKKEDLLFFFDMKDARAIPRAFEVDIIVIIISTSST